MTHCDPISDMLTRLRNALKARNRYVDLVLSNQKLNILKVLEKQGFIEHILVDDVQRKIRVFFKYIDGREPLIQGIRRISKPSLRYYTGRRNIPKISGELGIVILSTPLGIIDGKTAREKGVGGEVICYVW